MTGADGQPLRDEDNKVITTTAEVPAVYDLPVMETVTLTRTVRKPTGKTRLGLRYDELSMMLHAWSRRELARLADRVAALEAR